MSATLEALEALHSELSAVRQHQLEKLQSLEALLDEHAVTFKNLLDKKPRDCNSRQAVSSGKITIDEGEWALNQDFVDSTLRLADELDLDEVETAKLLLEADRGDDQDLRGRSLLECGILRFHQHRRYLLECMLLCIEIAADEELDENLQDAFGQIVNEKVFWAPTPGVKAPIAERMVPKCIAAMQTIRAWLQQIAEKMVGMSQLALVGGGPHEFQEIGELSRRSLVEQHEYLALLLCAAIEKRQAKTTDFRDLINMMKKIDRYDQLLVHLFPVLGAYITVFGSADGLGDLQQSRELNTMICKDDDNESWALILLRAAVQVWWIAEYSGWYLDDDNHGLQIDLDKEEDDRGKQFLSALKDGAFDFILAVAADCKSSDWQDPARSSARQWLQRKSPPLPFDSSPFTDTFQRTFMTQLEVLIDGAITNIPDVLRRLRTEEDEQRQLSQSHESDLDLERFLIIIAYTYEGRPEAAISFWEDPDSNLAGFIQWTSRRASAPLVVAFCTMLQSLADNEECATAAHNFLLDEGYHASGKMKRAQSLTWSQMFKEITLITEKARERPSATQTTMYPRNIKPSVEPAEAEPESAMMLESYLRLAAKLAGESELARGKLLERDGEMVVVLFRLASIQTIQSRVRACVFQLLRALLSRKTPEEGDFMWRCLDAWTIGQFMAQPSNSTLRGPVQNQPPVSTMRRTLAGVADGFDEPLAFAKFLAVLVQPAEGYVDLNDTLPFPEDLGISFRMPGVEPYVDYVLGHVFLNKTKDITDPVQLRLLRLSCLDFALTCLDAFNEDLFVLGNRSSSIAIDVAVSATDLATYARLHPFARVMEWMFNDDVIKALLSTVHQEDSDISKADPESPLILCVLRAISVITKVLDLQETYLDLVRPIVKASANPSRGGKPVANAAFASFEDGIMTARLELVVDLARYCSFGGPLIRPCLALLSRISTSSKIISAWNSGDAGRHIRRNKAIVALEQDGNATTLSHNLSSEILSPLDLAPGPDTPTYEIKLIILDFLYDCLRATPDRPSIAHLCLGFKCGDNSLSTHDSKIFETQKSLFHSLVSSFIELSSVLEGQCGAGQGVMPGYLLTLRHRILRVVRLLWSSSLSASLVLKELRVVNFPFHLLSHEVRIQPELCWDDKRPEAKIPVGAGPEFLVGASGTAYIAFLATHAMVFEYIGKELCGLSQSREHPTKKRTIFEALNGQVRLSDDGGAETLRVPNIFEFFDFLGLSSDQCDMQAPAFRYYKDMDLSACADEGGSVDSPHAASLFADAGVQYNIDKVRELLRLKRNEWRGSNMVIPQGELTEVEQEECILIDVLALKNRVAQLDACRLRVLRSWVNLLLVMLETNEFRGSVRLSFLLQSLQAILPSLESLSESSPTEAYELARLAKALLFKLDLSSSPDASTISGPDRGSVGNLVSEKLSLLFQTSLGAISKWAGGAQLRSVYYAICYWYLTGVVEGDDFDLDLDQERVPVPKAELNKTIRAIQVFGDRLLNVVCDDAYGSDPGCQTAALVLLNALVSLGSSTSEAGGSNDDDPANVVETLNRLNFIGVIVDSLKMVMADWQGLSSASSTEQVSEGAMLLEKSKTAAKLALLLRLCQSRRGAHHVLQAGLFRALDQSDAFAVDPELVVAMMLEDQRQQQGGTNARRRFPFAADGAKSGGDNGEEAAETAARTAAALERHYELLVLLARIVAAAVLAHPAAHHAAAGRRFVGAHRTLVAHTLKRSVGIGSSPSNVATTGSGGGALGGGGVAGPQAALEERIEELAEAFMVLIAATGFLEAENDVSAPEKPLVGQPLFH